MAELPTDRQLAMLTHVFDCLDADYGARWNASEQTLVDDAGTLTSYGARWLDQLASRTRDDILRGLRRLRRERPEWPPGAAGFADLCTPTAEDLGLPDVELAFRAACNGDWSCAAVWEAAKVVGVRRLRMAPERQTRKAFERVWALVVQRMQDGEVFEGRPGEDQVALAHLAPVPPGYEQDRAVLQRGVNPVELIRERLGQSQSSG